MDRFAWIGTLATAIALPLVFGTLRLLFPARPPAEDERSIEELNKAFLPWLRLVVVLWLFVFTPVAGWLCWQAFCELGARIAAGIPTGFYRSLPDGVTWALPAAFFGMLVGAVGVDVVLRLLFRRRYGAFVRYQERVGGISEGATLPLLLVLCLVGTLMVAAIGDWYLVVTPDEVVSDGFLVVRERHHAHADVVGIETAPYLKALLGGRPRRISVIHYADGSAWAIDELPGPISDEKILELTHYIAKRSGVPVMQRESLRRDFL